MLRQQFTHLCQFRINKWVPNDGLILPRLPDQIGLRFLAKRPGIPPIQSIPPEQRYKIGETMQIMADSPGFVHEPYPGPRRIPSPLDFFTKKGWRDIKTRVIDGAKNIYYYRLCKKHLDDFVLRKVKQEVLKIYKEVSYASATADSAILKKWVTAPAMTQIQKEITGRRAVGGVRAEWKMISTDPQIRLMRTRVLGIPDNRYMPSFAQCTFLVKNQQKYGLYNSRGQLIHGSEDDVIQVEDHWVFERRIKKDDPSTRWRVAARLAITSID